MRLSVKCDAYHQSAAPQVLHLPAQSRGSGHFQIRDLKYKLVSRDRSTIRLRSMSPSAGQLIQFVFDTLGRPHAQLLPKQSPRDSILFTDRDNLE